MRTIVYLHGAASTPLTFQYIRESLPLHKAILIKYDYTIKLKESLVGIIDDIALQLETPTEEINIVAHSLGGILALNVIDSAQFNVNKCITISAPFGGIESAVYLSMLNPFNVFLKEIKPHAPFIAATRALTQNGPVKDAILGERFLQIVSYSDAGGLMLTTENDTVVTTNSQVSLEGTRIKLANHNHFEVLQSPDVVGELKNFLDL